MKKSLKFALINSAIAGALVFFGAFSDGQITPVGIVSAVSASGIVFLTKIREYVGKIQSKKGMKGGYFEFI